MSDDEADGTRREVVGLLNGRGLAPAMRRAVGVAPPRRRLSTALSPDELTLMIRSHRVLIIPNPHRARQA